MKAQSKKKFSDTLYIAAIGASAGGLEALQKVISNIPDKTKHLAIIIVQHLSPNYKSMLVQSLSSQTSFEVIEVKNAISVKEKCIYITPPDREITLKKGKLFLSKPPKTYNPRPSINNLFTSLAEDRKAKSIGIILSGTGTDGANGMKQIEEAGGICIVQDPKTAKFNNMPQAAIESASVDFILSPSRIGRQLASIVSDIKTHKSSKTATNGDNIFEDIIELLTRETGTDFTNYKRETLFRRINKRISELKYTSANQYYKYIEHNREEVDRLFSKVLIGVTSFFRDAMVFKAMQKYVEKIIDSKMDSDPIRVWIAGCASGEEAYSIAILIDSALKKKNRFVPVQIFATDINENSLNIARKAIYQKKDIERLPHEIKNKYFIPRNGNTVEVIKPIRSFVLFSRHDLTHNPPFLKLDLIVCRNLLIYFNERLQEYVFPVFYSALNPNGYLLIGKSESIGQFNDLFSTVQREMKIFQRKAGSPVRTIRYTPLKIKRSENTESRDFTIPDMVKETIYKLFNHPYVVVNDALDIQEISGDVSLYVGLIQGHMNANLIKMANQDLKIELRSLVLKCFKENKETHSGIRKFTSHGHEHFVKISVRPLIYSVKPDEYCMVVFEEVKGEGSKSQKTYPAPTKKEMSRVKDLEQELEATKVDLQGLLERLEDTNSQLQSLNEELQSSNEELKISNEELETSNEELQSANEEINIAYAELKVANETLEEKEMILLKSEANIQALISNTLQAFILLDKGYLILSFNEVAVKTLKQHFGIKIKIGDNFQKYFTKKNIKIFANDFKSSLSGKTIRSEYELPDSKGKSYYFRFNFTPVLNRDKEVESVSFSMLDITELEKSKIELAHSQKLIESVFHTADIGLAIVNSKGTFVKVNEGFCKLLKYKINDLIGKSYLKIIPPGFKTKAKASEDRVLKGETETVEFKVIDKDRALLDVAISNKLFTSPLGETYVVKTIRDVSDERKYKDLFITAEKIMHIGSFEFNRITNSLACTNEIYNIFEVDRDFKCSLDSFGKFLYKDDSPLIIKAYNNLMRHRNTIEHELRIITANQKVKWVQIRSMPIILQSKVVGFRGSILDITARKEADKEINRLSWVAKHTNNGVIITDSKGKIEWVNQSFIRMTGYAPVDIKGKKPKVILYGDDTDKLVINKINECLKNKLPVREILLNYTKDKRPIWVSLDIAPIFENREIINYIYIITDITELIYAKEIQKTQEALTQRQRLMDAMAENFPEGIIGIINRELKYIYVGGRELKKLGHRANELVGDTIFEKISNDTVEYSKPFLDKVFNGENVYFEVTIANDIYGVQAVPIDRDQKPILRALVIIQNITKRKNAEQEMVLALKKQKELNELKSRFVTLASHEFRTPLGTILSSADLAVRFGDLKDEGNYKKHLFRIKSSVKSLTDILNEFLSLSRIEDGSVRNNPIEFNVKEFCEELLDDVESLKKTNQIIEYQHKGDQNIVFLDRWHLKNIISNLLSNAIKYTPQEKAIKFTSIINTNTITFIVHDEGMGIPEEDKPHLFETFFRASNASNIQGTGIGLHIVKRYLDIMGGSIDFKSEVNKGTVFTVVFPQP